MENQREVIKKKQARNALLLRRAGFFIDRCAAYSEYSAYALLLGGWMSQGRKCDYIGNHNSD